MSNSCRPSMTIHSLSAYRAYGAFVESSSLSMSNSRSHAPSKSPNMPPKPALAADAGFAEGALSEGALPEAAVTEGILS
jgi:hypothetical protein